MIEEFEQAWASDPMLQPEAEREHTRRMLAALESNGGSTTLSGTTITGPLRCEGNTPAPELRGVTVQGPRFGQCR
ncbi:hypothetical protein ACFVHW_02550 [Streptomyces sp. NPDC127110]|uniref:hypothetical protein n=1 Tax=Streptomyces sp. NPDC127110 TaxID=3345362 RepID=UPI00362F5DE8